jgi:hypothetical protein
MDFSHLQRPGDYSYTMTASVCHFFHFVTGANAALSGVCKTFDVSVLPLFALPGGV